MSEARVHHWAASDGIQLAFHERGQGRPVILLHGLFSDADMNWIKFGHAARIAAEGFRVIMPDLRAHGLSAKPHEPEHYPVGILARDLRELVTHLGLTDFDLGGFSLGSRTTVEGVGEGLKPRRAILGGAGLEGLRHWERRKNFFLEAIELFDRVPRGDPHWLSVQFMKSQKIDRVAAAGLARAAARTHARATAGRAGRATRQTRAREPTGVVATHPIARRTHSLGPFAELIAEIAQLIADLGPARPQEQPGRRSARS